MGFKITIYIGKLAAKTQGGSRHNTRLVFKTKNMKHILKFDAKIVKFFQPDGGDCQLPYGGVC